MKAIEEFLRRTMGLNVAAIGASLFQRTVSARMSAHGITQPALYLKLLRESADECSALISALVVTETWFFRDGEPFRAMARFANEEWLPAHPDGTLRLLSVPCSTGEEPYSMAMTLLDSGFPEARFQVDAVDISAVSISTAKRGEYRKNSFRGDALAGCSPHFVKLGKMHLLHPNVLRKARFQAGNLLDDRCLAGTGIYDFIFCRNLLIYFDPEAQERALRKLHKLLDRDGALFVGAAEMPIAEKHGFISAKLPLSFACKPVSDERSAIKENRICDFVPMATMATARAEGFPDLSRARQLAHVGRVAEAAGICEGHLRECGVSAEAFYLLGRTREAAGAQMQAAEFYRKALYLEPNHYETLLRWEALALKCGDRIQAGILRSRAERVQNRR